MRKETRTPAERRLISRAVKEIGHCEICGDEKELQGHHKIPRSVDPTLILERSNIIVLCANCHAGQHADISSFIARPIKRKGAVLVCGRCSKEFYVKASGAAKRKFCSQECTRAGKIQNCESCGEPFYVKRKHALKGHGRFCSQKCFGRVNGPHSAAVRWVNHPKKTCVCAACGVHFLTEFSRNAKFCSLTCFGKSNMAKRLSARA